MFGLEGKGGRGAMGALAGRLVRTNYLPGILLSRQGQKSSIARKFGCL